MTNNDDDDESKSNMSKAWNAHKNTTTQPQREAPPLRYHAIVKDYFLFGLEIGAVIEKSDSLQPTSNQVRKRPELRQFDSCLLL
jgi:hypothetical protein